MKRLSIALLAAALGAALPAAVPAAASAKGCPAGSKSESISGKSTCVGLGQTCNPSYESQYEKYGYACEYLKGKHELARKPSHGGGY